ncbi:MAG TPA: aldehyde dehydrogenase family protein [Solirubrobacteraceae bacterium]|nr:aldehyde dehydrogenase family protein [Solirubrobacteraceae bacterium]
MKVTYETFTPDDALAREFTRAVGQLAGELGGEHPFYVNGCARDGDRLGVELETAPHDERFVVGHFAQAGPADLDDAIESAHAFFAEWDDTPWSERVELVARVAKLVAARRFELAAILAYEAGKPLLEAIGEVDECVELVDYYCAQMRANEGFSIPMGAPSERERAYSVLRPYGVWAVIGPFNFPLALTLGPIAAALITGNTVVLKPSPHGYLSGHAVYRLFMDAGIPAAALHLLTIPEQRLGERDWFYTHAGLAGLTFTGSYETGMRMYRGFTAARPRPVICEMGGKNPAIVTTYADLDKAAAGIARSAFGYAGQRCSACSRAFVLRERYDELLARVLRARDSVVVGSPLDPASEIGPVIERAAVDRLLAAAAECRALGTPVYGGIQLREPAHGHYAEPTVAEVAPDARVMRDELFTPFLGISAVESFDHALELANGLSYGLTAGLYSENPAEIERFVQRIEAGVIYVNRAAGATSGAWPGVQPFGGWKASGNTGRGGGGLHYLQQYMREQSRTFVR